MISSLTYQWSSIMSHRLVQPGKTVWLHSLRKEKSAIDHAGFIKNIQNLRKNSHIKQTIIILKKKVKNIMLEGGKYIIQQIVKTNARFKTRSYVAVSDKRDLVVNFCLFESAFFSLVKE